MDIYQAVDGEAVIRSLRRWVRECGPIRKPISDQGAHSVDRRVQEWFRMGGIEHVYTNAYGHRSNGVVER